MSQENASTTPSATAVDRAALCSPLAERIIAAAPDLAKHDRVLIIELADRFWREDNLSSRFTEPPSLAYEAVESALAEVRANAEVSHGDSEIKS